ncbi:hypothetical protein G6M26_30850 [Agrobacterium tumefaciens]|nr:hypothetical protein [Agrobacterium tumefaciens]NTE22951.1 hypothetical protein [Agrobacterium tumefaciens]
MRPHTFSFQSNPTIDGLIKSDFSFKPLENYLKKLNRSSPVRIRMIDELIETLQPYLTCSKNNSPLFTGPDDQSLFDLIDLALNPLLEDEGNCFLAIASPLPGQIHYCTDAFNDLFKNGMAKAKSVGGTDQDVNLLNEYKNYIYRLILSQCYHFSFQILEPGHYSYINPETGLEEYYKINIDTRFVEVVVTGELPDITMDSIIQAGPARIDPLIILEKILPLHFFKLTGFAVITLENITDTFAIDQIRNEIVNHENEAHIYQQVIKSLRVLTGNNAVQFSLKPLARLNNENIVDVNPEIHSFMMEMAKQFEDEIMLQSLVKGYEENPVTYYFSAANDAGNKLEMPVHDLLKSKNVKVYACLPLFFKQKVVGILEIYAFKEILFFENILAKIAAALPLLSQLTKNSADHFSDQINDVVRQHFTVLQPSVLWKFHLAAWNYLQQQKMGAGAAIETITFDGVYAIYGAIDIKDSTLKRNDALLQDIHHILDESIRISDRLIIAGYPAEKIKTSCIKFKSKYQHAVTLKVETVILTFLRLHLKPLLMPIAMKDPDYLAYINAYLEQVNDGNGASHANRNLLEQKIGRLNEDITGFMAGMIEDLQQLHPGYIKTFRTDGIECDIYIGQSITPRSKLDNSKISAYRALQLRYMALMAKYSAQTSLTDSFALETTQLIFAPGTPINITFRNDEKRFDVEGADNINYEIIKKRIDKICIKGSTERLNQPGKIAIVYQDAAIKVVYLHLIRKLQEQGVLHENEEILHLEDLKDVFGLMAIRVEIKKNRTIII